jgi:LAO/AO transport system kinase
MSPGDRLRGLRAGGKAAFARTLAAIEAAPEAPDSIALLDAAHAAGTGRVIGLTGPPGVGKSTLIAALVGRLRARSLRVAVIAVDPSSPTSGGALLGDRTRFAFDPEDPDIFVRSMAARNRLGGIAEFTYHAVVLARALYDRVIVETVGVGQSETEIRDLADIVLLAVQPGSGDALQFMKAGILEIPDLIVVTKADLGMLAERARRELIAALQHSTQQAPAVHLVSATSGEGMEALAADLEARLATCGVRPAATPVWLERLVRDRFGRFGCARFREFPPMSPQEGPFARLARFSAAFEAALPPR